eukprot:6209310-Pleurochrysis_carterae.AAC.1
MLRAIQYRHVSCKTCALVAQRTDIDGWQRRWDDPRNERRGLAGGGDSHRRGHGGGQKQQRRRHEGLHGRIRRSGEASADLSGEIGARKGRTLRDKVKGENSGMVACMLRTAVPGRRCIVPVYSSRWNRT